MGEEVPYSDSYKRVLYIESVYRKHGITQADFDTSMVWYARHPDALTKVYEKVNQRLKAERDGINHLIALRDNKPKESLPGDSIDVWIAGISIILPERRWTTSWPLRFLRIPTSRTGIHCGGRFASVS